ncbi:MAG: peptidylprolyl isomerase [Sedimentisphaerales bacterium]
MTQAKTGDKVKINLTGRLEDGSVFLNTGEGKPLEFKIGEGKILPGIEHAVEGMNVGESKSVNVPPEQGFGQRRQELIEKVGRDKFPDNIEPAVGKKLQVPQQQGQPMEVTIVDVSDESVTLDANHPLAGKELAFDLELLEVT